MKRDWKTVFGELRRGMLIRMKEWLIFATENAIVLIDIIALIIVLVGTIEAFFGGLRVMLFSQAGA